MIQVVQLRVRAIVTLAMADDDIRITIGSVQIDLRSDGNAKMRRVIVPTQSITTIDGHMFVKLQRADNMTRRLLGHKCFASNPDIVQNLLRRTDVVEQLLHARHDAILGQTNVATGESHQRRNLLRSKAMKVALMSICDTVIVNGPTHGDITSKPILVRANLRGAVWAELSAQNMTYLMDLVKSQIDAGGVDVAKYKQRNTRAKDDDADVNSQDGSEHDGSSDLDEGGSDGDGASASDPEPQKADVEHGSSTKSASSIGPEDIVQSQSNVECPDASPSAKRTLFDCFGKVSPAKH